MASKKLSVEGQKRAKLALDRSIYSGQEGLARDAKLAYSTVNNFFNGHNILLENFKELCKLLNTDPTEVWEQPEDILDVPVNTSFQQPEYVPDAAENTFYVMRVNETGWYEQILKPHILIRIQAPAQFGKTALMRRILDRAKQAGQLTIRIDLAEIDRNVNLASFEIFLQQFIRLIEAKIDRGYIDNLMSDEEYKYWVDRVGSTKACLKYLEHLQDKLSQPLTLGIDRVDLLLAYPDTACDFFALLRVMNDRSIGEDGKWESFRLVLAYSTPEIESFIGVSGNQSPFNIGYPIELPEFTASQISNLALQRNISLQPAEIDRLMQSIGGIPYLVKLTLDRIQQDGVQILAVESTATNNIYQEHLRALARWIDKNNLRSAMHLVVHNPDATSNLSDRQQCLLHRQGLVVFANNGVTARCELYREYFLQASVDE